MPLNYFRTIGAPAQGLYRLSETVITLLIINASLLERYQKMREFSKSRY